MGAELVGPPTSLLRLGPRLRDICGFWSLLEIMLEKEYNSAQIFYVASFDVASQTPP